MSKEAAELFEGPVAKVRVGLRQTVNTGDYNSVQAEVSIERECNEDDIDDVMDEVSSRVREELDEQLTYLTENDDD